MDVQLAWSWDLVNWTRPAQRPSLLPRGGMIVTARAVHSAVIRVIITV